MKRRPEERTFAETAHPTPEVALGAGVLVGWVVLFYLGLMWFRRMAGRGDEARPSGGPPRDGA